MQFHDNSKTQSRSGCTGSTQPAGSSHSRNTLNVPVQGGHYGYKLLQPSTCLLALSSDTCSPTVTAPSACHLHCASRKSRHFRSPLRPAERKHEVRRPPSQNPALRQSSDSDLTAVSITPSGGIDYIHRLCGLPVSAATRPTMSSCHCAQCPCSSLERHRSGIAYYRCVRLGGRGGRSARGQSGGCASWSEEL